MWYFLHTRIHPIETNNGININIYHIFWYTKILGRENGPSPRQRNSVKRWYNNNNRKTIFVFVPAKSWFSFHFLFLWKCNSLHIHVPLYHKLLFVQGFQHWIHSHKKESIRLILPLRKFYQQNLISMMILIFVPYTMSWSTSYSSNVNIWCAIVHGNAIITYILKKVLK